MLVHQILRIKSGEGVVTVSPDMTVSEAVALLSGKKIGAVIVSADGVKPEGILSERDVVRELGRRGPDCLGDSVKTMMTSPLIGCAPQDSAHSVLEKMTEGRFRHMPVMQGDAMIGLISIGDVVKARLTELSMERDALESMVMGH